MKRRDLLSETLLALTTNKIRTGLTMLGVVIGIASVVTLVSIGQGATNAVRANIEALGSNLLTVAADKSGGPQSEVTSTLTSKDVQVLANDLQDISGIAATIQGYYPLTNREQSVNSRVQGVQPDYARVRNVLIQSGAFFTGEQDERAAKVVVLGSAVRDQLFGPGIDPTGQFIRINQTQFQVIGVTVAKGGSGEESPDSNAYIPFNTIRRYLAGMNAPIDSISIAAVNEQAITHVDTQARGILMAEHNLTDWADSGLTIRNQTEVATSLTETTRTLTVLLAAVAGISLLVGGIGIMNMMLTSVTERTREIGLRKAVGATRRDIQAQFLTESVCLTLLGGALGVVLGFAVAWTVSLAGISTAAVTWWSVGLALIVTSFVGIVFGYYPARRAAKLSPIRALQYQ
jgi:ABC-type antimicrobial peptide transport system permease subunit